MKKAIFTFTIAILISSTGFSNAYNFWLTLQGGVSHNNLPVEGAKITVFKNGIKEKSFTSNKKGKITYTLHENAIYEVRVEKDGYITKTVEVNTTIPDWFLGAHSFAFEMDMIKSPFRNSPEPVKIAKVEFKETAQVFANDWDYTEAKLLELTNEVGMVDKF